MHRGRVGTGLGLGLGFRVRLCWVFLSEDEVFDLRITEDFYNRWTYKVPGNINFPGRPAVAQVLYAPNRNAIGSLPLFPRHPMSHTEMQWLCTAVTQAPCAPNRIHNRLCTAVNQAPCASNRNAMGSVPLCPKHPMPQTGMQWARCRCAPSTLCPKPQCNGLGAVVPQAPCAPNRNAMGSVPLCPIPHTGAGHSGTRYSGPTA